MKTIATVGAIAAATAIGGVAADPGPAWYRRLRKPRWQPPPPAYALVWTPLYVTIAHAGHGAHSMAHHYAIRTFDETAPVVRGGARPPTNRRGTPWLRWSRPTGG